jgi:phosphoribosylaminoimidazolecarboxamide formyltransferase/IMP cyclohydrolase
MGRALLSVYDKTGLVELGRGLESLGFELIASGGTAKRLHEAGLPVTSVDEVTGHPEILGGRVKTLHPAIHGGILARGTASHQEDLAAHGIGSIDVVVCNLYPFRETVARADVTEAQAVEEIDIGGVTLLRAAAKNFESVTVVCDPADYETVLTGLRSGAIDQAERRRLALTAFRHTASYDAAISAWFATQVEAPPFPGGFHFAAEKVATLRYGENPHQDAALYRWEGIAPTFEQVQGKALSYNNIVDLEAAWAMPFEFGRPAVAIIKHTNPCGLATADNIPDAFKAALESDPVSAFGSVVALNRPVGMELLELVGKLFVEVLAAPSFSDEALQWLAARKPNCRVMIGRQPEPGALTMRSTSDGFLVQTEDDRGVDPATWRVVTERVPTEEERAALEFIWLVTKHVKSNAIILGRGTATVGVGAGQMSRVDSVRLAVARAGERSRGSVLGSDAFFPFPDGIEEAAAAGVTAVVQPGGSKRDEVVIEVANRLGLAMVMTGERHFRH